MNRLKISFFSLFVGVVVVFLPTFLCFQCREVEVTLLFLCLYITVMITININGGRWWKMKEKTQQATVCCRQQQQISNSRTGKSVLGPPSKS